MNDYKLPPDDPRLTAYALGELEGEELAAVEAALRADPQARAVVEEIRATSLRLTAALAAEPMPTAITPAPQAALGNLVRFPRVPQLYYIVGTLAAACVALVVTLRQPEPAVAQKTYREVTLAPSVTPGPAMTVNLPSTEPMKIETTAATAQEVAIGPAEIVAPAAVAEMANQTLNPDQLSLLGQAKSAENVATRTTPPPVAPANDIVPVWPTETEIVQTAGAAESPRRVYTFPQDDKFVRSAQSSGTVADDKSVITAVPRAPTLVTPKPAPSAPSPGSLLDRATGNVVQPDGSMTFSGGQAAPRGDTLLLSPSPLALSGALLESAREALLRPLPVAPAAGTASIAIGGPDNNFVNVAVNPVSAFAIDADTSAYDVVRRFLLQFKRLPPRETVRIEELVNRFTYHYPSPRDDAPFAASMEVADAPWAPEHRLVRIGLKAREVQTVPRPAMNLVFVFDVVDVERQKSRLPMMKEAVVSLLGKLRPEDRVALVSCRDNAALALSPTPVARSREILDALDTIAPGGSTSRMKGLQLAYDLVQAGAVPGGSSRVILCTDGNAAITITAEGAFANFLAGKARSGVALTAFGFGMGLYRDPLIEFLAEWGRGNYGYIDTRRDADKMLAEDVNGPAVTIAKDVKIEVEFNPARVASYRLIGYENRALGQADFKAGSLAAEEISAGHAVTALFEIVPADGRTRVGPGATEGLRYQPPKNPALNLPAPDQNELLTVKVRYKKPGGAIKRKLDLPVADAHTSFVNASADFKFAAAVAGFGMVLRGSPYKGTATLASVVEWAEAGTTGDDPGGYRGEFLELAREADRQVR